MRKKKYLGTLAAILCTAALSGCQKAPEAAADSDIPHAGTAIEQQASDGAGEQSLGEQQSLGQQPEGYFLEQTLGTGENKMTIRAQIPAVPEHVYQMTLLPDDTLGKDALLALLEVGEDAAVDSSQELLEEIAQSDYDNTHGPEGEYCYYSRFSDRTALQFSAGQREASLEGHTSVGYKDSVLWDRRIGMVVYEDELIPPSQADTEGEFPLREAKRILLDKLEPLGIKEVSFWQIRYCKGDGDSYYELFFAPVQEGVSMIKETGSYGLGEIYPEGWASVTPDGVAELTLRNFCARIGEKEPVTVLPFEKIEQCLEQYLDNGLIVTDDRMVFDHVELEYYPLPNTQVQSEMEYRQKLELIPIWHIYITMEDYVEKYAGLEEISPEAVDNICINGVTGEVERAE